MSVGSVCVIVPHHNRPELVHKALLSIHAQTVKAAQILLVDDNSSPENREKVMAMAHLATILTTQGSVGPAVARNWGVEQAKTEWVTFLDDDDLYLPDKLERQIKYLNAHPEVVALGGGAHMVHADGTEELWGKADFPRRLNLANAISGTAAMPQALMIRRDVFLALGGFDPQMVQLEDFEFGIRLLAAGNETHVLGDPLFIYHRGGHEQLTSKADLMLRTEMRLLRMHADLIRQQFGPLGMARLKARARKKYGLWQGGLAGRGVWAMGRIAEVILGSHVEQPRAIVTA